MRCPKTGLQVVVVTVKDKHGPYLNLLRKDGKHFLASWCGQWCDFRWELQSEGMGWNHSSHAKAMMLEAFSLYCCGRQENWLLEGF